MNVQNQELTPLRTDPLNDPLKNRPLYDPFIDYSELAYVKTVWHFSICYDPSNPPGPYSIGIRARNPEEVDLFGASINAAVSKNDISPYRLLRVELLEGDPRLQILLERIESAYGLKPSKWLAIPLEERSRFFGVRKLREYSKKDLESTPFLCLHADKDIATQEDGTAKQVNAEVYVVEADRLQTTRTQFGALFPFHGLCVAERLGRQLADACLKGLHLDSVVILPADQMTKPLFKLSSTVIAPRSLLPIVNEAGHQVEPNTKWASYLDDGGYQPHEFKYRQSDLEHFQSVDIAMSYERTGVTKARAYRWCLVSQQFRRVMTELKVKGVQYAPVRFLAENNHHTSK